ADIQDEEGELFEASDLEALFRPSPPSRPGQVQKPPLEPLVRAGQRKVKVPQHCVGRILGKMGATIKKIQEASNTYIKVNQDTKEAGYSYAIVTSKKNLEVELDTAQRLLKEKIAGGPNWSSDSTRSRRPTWELRFAVTAPKFQRDVDSQCCCSRWTPVLLGRDWGAPMAP
ncbi:unnamed protein product, partial [Symbiodinium natans]